MIDRVFPLLVFFCITQKPKKNRHIFMVIVFTISCKTCNHRCQRKQMHQNYFRITTALCHLTAVLFCVGVWPASVRFNSGEMSYVLRKAGEDMRGEWHILLLRLSYKYLLYVNTAICDGSFLILTSCGACHCYISRCPYNGIPAPRRRNSMATWAYPEGEGDWGA